MVAPVIFTNLFQFSQLRHVVVQTRHIAVFIFVAAFLLSADYFLDMLRAQFVLRFEFTQFPVGIDE